MTPTSWEASRKSLFHNFKPFTENGITQVAEVRLQANSALRAAAEELKAAKHSASSLQVQVLFLSVSPPPECETLSPLQDRVRPCRHLDCFTREVADNCLFVITVKLQIDGHDWSQYCSLKSYR